jgi:hypothetical protein
MANVIGNFCEVDCILLFEVIRNIIFLHMYQLCCNFEFDNEPKNTKHHISSLKRTNSLKMQYLYIGPRCKLHQPHKFIFKLEDPHEIEYLRARPCKTYVKHYCNTCI